MGTDRTTKMSEREKWVCFYAAATVFAILISVAQILSR